MFINYEVFKHYDATHKFISLLHIVKNNENKGIFITKTTFYFHSLCYY